MTDLEKLRELPTIMTAEEELVVVRELMTLPRQALCDHRDAFVSVVEHLDESHAGGGSFGLTPENEGDFHHFAAWLRATGGALGLDWHDAEWSFDVTWAQMVRAFPGMQGDVSSQPPSAEESGQPHETS